MKDPVGIFGRWRGFSFWALHFWTIAARPPTAMRSGGLPIGSRSRNQSRRPDLTRPGIFSRKEGRPMPAWLEILLNVIGFAGFIGIAKYHKAPGGKLPDR